MMIRDAVSEDGADVARLIEILGYPASPESVAYRVNQLAASPTDRLVVAEIDGRVVGLASIHVSLTLEHDKPAAKLSAIVVDERHRRRGIGAALATAMEAEARRRGCCLIFVTTAERRRDAHAFYEGIGYEETGRRFAKWLH
jgi:GNAT superfamily N-acetyltransferase